MFRLDCDPAFFEETIEESNLNNNNIGQGQKDWDIESWISTPTEFIYSTDLPESLFEGDTMEKKETPPASPLPAMPSQLVEDAVEVKSEVKSEKSFDLIRYIIFGEVSQIDDFEIMQLLEQEFLWKQESDLLTPVEEKAIPTFEIVHPATIKVEPEPSTSAEAFANLTENVENVKPVRLRVPKRRYSSDSEFSIGTESNAHSTNRNRSSKKKRGRPAKELITDLPTVDDFSHMPIEHASHLVLRIKNNEASRKSRMKSRSKQSAMEDECDRLTERRKRLTTKQNKLEGQIETMRRWLLGIN